MLPSILLSGFMFPFRGMPAVGAMDWASALPATHFMPASRRGVMLKGASFEESSTGSLWR